MDEYQRGYHDGYRDAVDALREQVRPRLSKRAQRTSREAVTRNIDSIKGVQRTVYDLLYTAGDAGYTDMELESHTGRSHQSISAARNALMNAGLVKDSGQTRTNARGNKCIVWILASPASKDTHDRRTADDYRSHASEWGQPIETSPDGLF